MLLSTCLLLLPLSLVSSQPLNLGPIGRLLFGTQKHRCFSNCVAAAASAAAAGGGEAAAAGGEAAVADEGEAGAAPAGEGGEGEV